MDLRFKNPAPMAVAGGVLTAAGWFGLAGPAAAVVVPVGVLLLGVAIAGFVFKPERPTMYWRGQVIDMSENLSAWGRIYYRLFKG